MIRNTAREIAVHLAYQLNFTALSVEELLDQQLSEESFASLAAVSDIYADLPGKKQEQYIRSLVSGIALHQGELDGYIEKYARGWKFSRIPMMAVAIMRVALYEILYREDIPNRVAINEAVEIAKRYETEETAGFINGILGSFLKDEGAEESKEDGKEE